MKSIRIKNLRSLQDTGLIQLKNINLLIGKNSSGKSTFLRCFPLLRQSFEVRSTAPILWYGRDIDFGSFNDALNDKCNKKEIEIQFTANSKYFLRKMNFLDEDIDIVTFFSITIDDDLITYINYFSIEIFDHKIELLLNNDKIVDKIIVNGSEIKNNKKMFWSKSNFLLPLIYEDEDMARENINNYYTDLFRDKLLNLLENIFHKNTGKDKIMEFIRGVYLDRSSDMLNLMKNFKEEGYWRKTVGNWDTESVEFKDIMNLIIAININRLILAINEYIYAVSINTKYITPIRSTAQRFYRVQELSIDEIDIRGENIAIFLRNLNENEKQSFMQWTNEYFGFTINTISTSEHISINIKENDHEKDFNLADVGFGFSQIIPVITQLWTLVFRRNDKRNRRDISFMRNYPIIFTVEQPELHLHPQLQAKLADAFASVIKYANDIGIELKLIIETHSEVIINRFGHILMEKDIIDKDMINVIIFEKNEIGLTNVSVSNYDENGYLTNWPIGFFDYTME